ncbi:TolC family protein [Pedobacter mucosus]|uniref:TolC family protein n=1 Tax=Pedobacter mucosus TaxID=2895286 RepID=UPI001EE437F4|nr:TolC family protein [Pedobacter mucosus]UKT64903.1 TolC family protein [Pedobacter mucosus]
MKRIGMVLVFFMIIKSEITSAKTDTLQLDLKKVDSLFIRNNFDLLASGYQIDQSKAEIITAKLFNNPELTYENQFYNPEHKKFFQTSFETGQYAASISQLFKLAGKRNKNIKLAETGVKLAELAYFDLIRTLRFELHNTFYKTYFSSQTVNLYQDQIASTQQLLKVYDAQLKTGNVAAKDVIRIRSLVISLKSELASLLNELEDNYKDLKVLCGLQASASIAIVLDQKSIIDNKYENLEYSSLLDSARANRSDLKLAKTGLQYNDNNLKLQKAMAVPDVEVAFSYDLKGNYPERYTGLGIKIPIPLFNRNQGEIKKARIGIDAATMNIKKKESLLENEVLNSYRTARRNEENFQEIDPSFSNDFNNLIAGLIKNFRERNISLIEFLDLYESYKDMNLQLNKIQLERMSSREEVNFVTGSNIFK